MKLESEVKVSNRKSAFAELKDYCISSMGEDREDAGDFLEVTEWTNGEGYDIYISDIAGEKQFHLTWGQFKALKKCIRAIEKL